MEIGKQIKKYRTDRKLSQEALAERIFVSRQTISNWENDRNYPDMKSLLLLSSLFNVSLDILVKGDLEEMKKEIKKEEISKFEKDGKIFTILLIADIILVVPLMKVFGKNMGFLIFILIWLVSMYYASKVERHKKNHDVKTYKELNAFLEGRTLEGNEKYIEYGKRPYQSWAIALGVGLITAIVAFIMAIILF
ncbi:helix-turn-helix domain-containing protein [Paraclostridium sp. AKS73]|uniref:helix-turn-helix domain-containing protein n=1 Tax=Paraclostridium sp. AKS73 TaxID=2876116 RepID=UPI0021DFB1EE|nr:helix-turn-helix transcriptional regulator [Paraclostridium sp. AKS73]MCU9815797.1 helix-turn-helix domain-containing protein [Paraclostridium sp. AKS73]MDM8127959.1 helix-turn-helix transcriptional regulator [Paraclostridium benzoelyticum]